MSVYEKAFASSDKTDAVLVVDGKKLHVNKALLSVHSDYFADLFNSDSEEFQIENVDFEDFATVLSLIHPEPLKVAAKDCQKLLELADRFCLPGARRHLELIAVRTKIPRLEKLRIAASMCEASLDGFEAAFPETDKTDVALVVDGKKLHVNKALLSIHSDYFNVLFNSDFREKTMKEIEIKDVNYEDFVIMLSLIHPYPFWPYNRNMENILDLADRFFIPAVNRHLELVLLDSKAIPMDKFEKVRIADKYQMEELFQQGIEMFREQKKHILELLELVDQFICPDSKCYIEQFIMNTNIDRLEKLRIADKYMFDELKTHAILLFTRKYDFRLIARRETFKCLSDQAKNLLYERLLAVAKN